MQVVCIVVLYSEKILQGFNFAFFVILAKLQKCIREIFSFAKISLVYCSIVKQGSFAIIALLKYFRFSRGLFLILNARCQAQ